jgi:hypothetical protein
MTIRTSLAVAVAEEFYTAYNTLAPTYGYRPAPTGWPLLPDTARDLLIAVTRSVLASPAMQARDGELLAPLTIAAEARGYEQAHRDHQARAGCPYCSPGALARARRALDGDLT